MFTSQSFVASAVVMLCPHPRAHAPTPMPPSPHPCVHTPEPTPACPRPCRTASLVQQTEGRAAWTEPPLPGVYVPWQAWRARCCRELGVAVGVEENTLVLTAAAERRAGRVEQDDYVPDSSASPGHLLSGAGTPSVSGKWGFPGGHGAWSTARFSSLTAFDLL